MLAATAGQPRHFFLHRAGGNAEQTGNPLALLRRTDRALSGNDVAMNDLLRKVATAGLAAGAAVRLGQQFLDLADARVLEDIKLLVGEGEHQRQDHSQSGHECPRYRQIRQRLHSRRLPRQCVPLIL
jgi:hypothetical protein